MGNEQMLVAALEILGEFVDAPVSPTPSEVRQAFEDVMDLVRILHPAGFLPMEGLVPPLPEPGGGP